MHMALDFTYRGGCQLLIRIDNEQLTIIVSLTGQFENFYFRRKFLNCQLSIVNCQLSPAGFEYAHVSFLNKAYFRAAAL